MRVPRLIAAVVVAAALLAPDAGAQSATSLASVKAVYEKSLQKIEEECQAKAKEAPAQYERKLDELGATVQKSGDLDALLAVNKEKARFKTERSVPETSPADLPAVLIKLQEEHRASLAQFGKEKSRKILTLTKQYLAYLEAMKKDLTTQGKFDSAIAVRDEIKRAESSEAYANAQKDAPPAEPKPAQPEPPKQDPAALTALKKGLILHYSFDKDEDGKVTDLSGTGTHGTAHGTKWVPEGISGGAYAFDGKDDYISVPRTVQDSFAISAWIKTTAAGGGTAHYQSMPIYDSEIALQITCDFGFGVNSDGQLVFGEGGGGDATVTGRTRVNTGAWVHACAVRNKETGEMEIYVNGKSDARGVGSTATLNANPKARIGYGFDNAGNVQYWNGQMDDVRLYKRALGAQEVKALFLLHGGGRASTGPTAEAEKEIVELMNRLADADPQVRREAKSKLKEMGSKARPILMRNRGHQDPEVRAAVEELLKP